MDGENWLNAPDTVAPSTGSQPRNSAPPDENWLNAPDTGNTPAPTAQSLGFSDVPGALMSGLRRGIGDVGETFGATGQAPESPAAAPFEWSDLTNPGSAAAKFSYRLGESSPTTAAGIAGGVAGTAVTGGPWGGIGGGAIGAAGGAALQTLGPAFHRELQATPDDPEGAWSRALSSAMRSGAFSGAAWAAFPMRFFEGPIKNAAFQIFGVQPAISVAHQATENVATGRPALEGTLQAGVEGAVGAAAPILGRAAVGRITGDSAARAAAAKVNSGEPPTSGELENIADQHYADLDNAGIVYHNQAELDALQSRIGASLRKAGFDPRTEKRAFTALETLSEGRNGPGQPLDWQDVEHVRKMLNNAMADTDRPTRAAAAMAIHGPGGFDEWLENPHAQIAAGVDPALANDLSTKANLARGYWRAAKGMEAFNQIIEKANNASNAREVTFRNEIRKIVNDPRKQWQYPPEAIDLMRQGLHRGFWQAAAHASKLFDPHSSFGLFTNFMSHSMFGPEGLLAMPAAMTARYIGQRPLARVEEQVPGMIAGRATGKTYRKPTLSERTKSNYTPYVGPMVPQPQQQQQQARGGKIGRALAIARRADGGSTAVTPEEFAAFGPPGFDAKLSAYAGDQEGTIDDRRGTSPSPFELATRRLSAATDRFMPQFRQSPKRGNLAKDAGYYDIGAH